MATIVCTQCYCSIIYDVVADGLPEEWANLPLARPGETTHYTASDGSKYTLDDVSGDAFSRPHAALCPRCVTRLL